MKPIKTILFYSLGLIISLLLFSCSSDDNGVDENNNPINTGDSHTYEIIFDNGKELKGTVPNRMDNLFYHHAFIDFNTDTGRDRLHLLLLDLEKCEISIGADLDENNQPIIDMETSMIVFSDYSTDQIYYATDYSATITNFKKHAVDTYHDFQEVASFTLQFEGTFIDNINQDFHQVTGTIIIVEP